MELLRAREAKPSFARIEALVAAAPTRSLKAIPLFTKVFGSLLGIGVTGAIFLMNSSQAPRKNIPLARSRVETNSRYAGPSPHLKFSEQNKILVAQSAASRLHIRGSSASAHTADSALPLISCQVSNSIISLTPIARDTRPLPSIALVDSEREHYFFATIGGTLSQQFSSNVAFRQFSFSDAFFGMGYAVSQNSSIRILGGEEIFAISQNGYYVTYHDTTFIHNGTPYANIIGEVHPTAGSAIARVYWLGASYRYTFGEETRAIRPFAELTVAGSTNGFLSHQSLGAELNATSRMELDLLFEASELLPQNSSWLPKAGLSAEIAYRW